MKKEKLRRIKNVEGLGYKVYYDEEKNCIEFNTEYAKRIMQREVKNGLEKCMCDEFEMMYPRDFEVVLRKYDYGKRAINENAKCSVVFLAVMSKATVRLSKENQKFKDAIEDMLSAFTEDECSFAQLVEFNNALTDRNMTNGFFNTCMDYIMNMLLRYGF